ncbi:enolase-phosphatase E1-like isoform X2 [Patiria miniata]|uniref:Enolase-phosphatase E1 n=1 Tax=Patiria miniata TaxID=46514 RepID=A0A914B968_PATMI|nr:enolase-phosphatase E1-like isoform X2 [Patiria miniata]
MDVYKMFFLSGKERNCGQYSEVLWDCQSGSDSMMSQDSDKNTSKHPVNWLDLLQGIEVIVLDIEGTTTPITFVKDVLFPYVTEHLEDYLDDHWEEKKCQDDVRALRDQANLDKDLEGVVTIPEDIQGDSSSSKMSVKEAVMQSIRWLMAADRKVTALKQLQGHMWRSGYKDKTLVAQVYSDVLPAIKQWISDGKKVYIYSSGSVEAQKLLFGHTDNGSLLELFSGYFDTKIGSKVEKESYLKIAAEVGSEPGQILFLTDVTREALPASQAGLKTAIVVRDGNAPLTEDETKSYQQIKSFSELLPDDGEPLEKIQKQ